MDRFEIEDKEYFIKIDPKGLAEGKKAHGRAFRESLEGGALLRKGLAKYMKEQGVWDDEKETEYRKFVEDINDMEHRLSSGRVDGRLMKISEGKDLALLLSERRRGFRNLIAERNLMDSDTAEGQADNVQFEVLLVHSVYDYTTQKRVFDSADEYTEKNSEELTIKLASKFANIMYGVDDEYEKNLTESKFLKRFKLIDDKGRFINKEGHLVDVDGCVVDDEGYRLDPDGNRVDLSGRPLNVNVETAEFEDDSD